MVRAAAKSTAHVYGFRDIWPSTSRRVKWDTDSLLIFFHFYICRAPFMFEWAGVTWQRGVGVSRDFKTLYILVYLRLLRQPLLPCLAVQCALRKVVGVTRSFRQKLRIPQLLIWV